MATTDITQETLEEWRAKIFEELGFDSQQAAALAVSKDENGWHIETHKVAQMLENGCTHDLAIDILL